MSDKKDSKVNKTEILHNLKDKLQLTDRQAWPVKAKRCWFQALFGNFIR